MSLGGIDTIAQTNGLEVSAASLLRHPGAATEGGPLQPYKGGRGFRLPVYGIAPGSGSSPDQGQTDPAAAEELCGSSDEDSSATVNSHHSRFLTPSFELPEL
ncbi:hypothetical protein MHYP_G00349510 [Metynnis hypsauchen]